MKKLTTKELMLLSIVGPRRLAGRAVAEQYKARTGKWISYGTIYCTMTRLFERGLVRYIDDTDEDGKLRLFQVTDAGFHALGKG